MVTIIPYKLNWPNEFQKIGGKLRHSLGDTALRIDHIGSTSIPGLAAKDRIDIQITVESLAPAIEKLLTRDGYQKLQISTDHIPKGIKSHPDNWVKWVFINPPHQRPTNLHVRINGRTNQRYALLFRDYLRTHQPVAQAYAELKERLSENIADPDLYPDVKDPAVDLIYFAAEDWSRFTGWQLGPSDA
ncbi:MAG: GrpB family protein [Chloroflexota bacterium]|nr:MAG: GrpB family protein [Chloroflexota bacterium]